MGNLGYDQVFVVDLANDSIVDTLTGFGSVIDVRTTRSGKKLYVTTRQGLVNSPGAVFVVDLFTKSKKVILEKAADVYLEPTGIPLIVASTPYDTMRQIGTIDTVTDVISFFDTLDILDTGHNYEALVFDPVRPILYTWTSRNQLFCYDYQQKQMVRYYKSVGFPVLNMIMSQRGDFIYFANGPVLDVANDAPAGWIPGNNESTLGSLALSPDGGQLYLTDPGKPMMLEPMPSGKINIFQTSTNDLIGSIDVNKASGQAYTMTNRIVIAPDGARAYVSGNFGDVFVIDLAFRMVVHVISFGNRNVWIESIALG